MTENVTIRSMAEPKLKSDVSESSSKSGSQTDPTPSAGHSKPFIDPLTSSRGGIAGFAETLLRRFKIIMQLFLVLPLYFLGAMMIGVAAMPGIMIFDFLTGLSSDWPSWGRAFMVGTAGASAFVVAGFALIFVSPLVNFALRANCKPWRGPYYSLEAIRWFVHNGATYLVRFTFLEFVTPSPFNLLFYRMMGMKIGRGTTINSSHISDPSMIELGEKVTIGGSATIVAHYGQGGYLVLAPTKIEDGATIGLKATIMGGVTVGAGAKVLSNSVVLPKTQIPPGETWGGIPAKKIDL
jgi:hypothetical protein